MKGSVSSSDVVGWLKYAGRLVYQSSIGFWRFSVSSGVRSGLEIRRW